MARWDQDDDYEYGYDYLYEENEKQPADADEQDEESWWEDNPDKEPDVGIDEIYALDDEINDEPEAALAEEAIIEALTLPISNFDEPEPDTGRKMLIREMKAEALRRFEEAARTEADFRAIVATWDKLDNNRERRERSHELLRGEVPIEYGIDFEAATTFPRWKCDPTERQIARGNFLDYLFDCPYEMHDLTSKAYLRKILLDLKEEHKEILFFLYLRQYSPQLVALMRGQTDRNIRKVRDTVIRKIHKKMYEKLQQLTAKGYRVNRDEQEFMRKYEAENR